MSKLHEALSHLRPKDFSEVPIDDLKDYLPDIFTQAELIANSVPPPPNGTPFESSQRSRSDANGATSAAELTVSKVRRPPPRKDHEELQKSWGKPIKMSAKETATGISVYKMAGHDRHGAWFARTSVHEGLGFAKWKRAMMREFPESLAVQGGPGEGNVRGIGGDQRLEDITIEGVGKLEVYQLSAQFPGPTSPREFITLLLTSENCLSEASNVDGVVPRHYMVVSIPVTHPDAPPRDGLVRGFYESVELIREIPLVHPKSKARAKPGKKSDDTVGDEVARKEEPDDDDPETNPVEWIMITRSDPGGGIPRFMVERSTPSSIVGDALKFLDWACSKDHIQPPEGLLEVPEEGDVRKSVDTERAFSISESNGILAGVGTSIADREDSGVFGSVRDAVKAYAPDAVQSSLPVSLQRTDSHSSSSTATSSLDSFASAEQFNTAPDGLPRDYNADPTIPTPSSLSTKSLPVPSDSADLENDKTLQNIQKKKEELTKKLNESREKQAQQSQQASLKSAKELEKTTERHAKERKKQEDKFAREVRKLEERRERETKKLLAKQQKEADKNLLLKTQKETEEWKEKAEAAEKENKLLKEQIGELQRENTILVRRIGKTEGGLDVLKLVREEMEGKRPRASSRASMASSRGSEKGSKRSLHSSLEHEVTPEDV